MFRRQTPTGDAGDFRGLDAASRRTADKLEALARSIRSLHPENMNARDFAEMRRDFLEQIECQRDLALAMADLWESGHEHDHS